MMSEQRHLQRLGVVWQRQPLYFVTTCSAGRRPLFANAVAHEILRQEWSLWRERHGWAVGHYVVMPDHVHFFAAPLPEGTKALGSVMGKWKEWTAKGIAVRMKAEVPIWQPEFFDHLLRNRESYRDKWMYVRENPVRARLVKTADEWPYAGWVNFA